MQRIPGKHYLRRSERFERHGRRYHLTWTGQYSTRAIGLVERGLQVILKYCSHGHLLATFFVGGSYLGAFRRSSRALLRKYEGRYVSDPHSLCRRHILGLNAAAALGIAIQAVIEMFTPFGIHDDTLTGRLSPAYVWLEISIMALLLAETYCWRDPGLVEGKKRAAVG